MKSKWTHGGNVYEVRRRFGLKPEAILDFSANINPLGMPPYLKDQIIQSLEDLVHYPDPDYFELKQAIAAYTGVSKAHVQCGNGAIELLYMLAEYLKPQRACVIAPGFVEYERSLERYGATIDWLTLGSECGFKLGVDDVKRAVTPETDLLIICNPNNPTGHLIPKQDVVAIIKHCKAQGCSVIVDESFIDFIGLEASVVDQLENYEGLFVLRSMTKFFAIPGLRLGYLLSAHEGIHEWCENYRTPWMINHLANIAGIAVLKDHEYILKTLEVIPNLRVQLCEALKEIPHVKVFDSQANYLFFKYDCPEVDLKQKLIEQGIMIRSCSNYHGLDATYYRIAVKSHEANTKFIEAMKNIEVLPE